MGTLTDRFQLYKADPSENVNIDSAVNEAFDKLDSAAKLSELNQEVNDLTTMIQALQTAVFGSATRSVVPMCKISKTGDQTIADTAQEDVTFGQVDWESEGVLSQLGLNAIKINQKGIYLTVFNWTWIGAIGGNHKGYIKVNGNNRAGGKSSGGSGSTDAGGCISSLNQLQVDTMVTSAVWQSSGANQKVTNSGIGTWLGVVYLGRLP